MKTRVAKSRDADDTNGEPRGEKLKRKAQAMDRRLVRLQRQVAAWKLAPQHKAAVEEGLANLAVTLEELRVTQEELAVQNEALALAQQQYAEERTRYQELFEFAPDAYLVTDHKGVVREANRFAVMMFNILPQHFRGKPMFSIIRKSDHAAFFAELLALNDKKKQVARQVALGMTPRKRPEFDASVSASAQRDPAGHVTSIRWLIRDVTAVRHAAEQLREYQQRLRSLTGELSLAEERERRRIAVEIHDRISQTLAMARLKVASLNAQCSGDEQPILREVMALLDQSLDDTRTLTFELSPPVLYELGLLPAIEWLGEQAQRRNGLKVIVEGHVANENLTNDARVLLFQSVRELLMNVVKHGNASMARVTCRMDEQQIRLSVADDGRGFDAWSASQVPEGHGGGFGLFSIRTRVEEIGGKMDISSVPGGGSRVTLIAPLNTSAGAKT